jgi:hypothetical protein
VHVAERAEAIHPAGQIDGFLYLCDGFICSSLLLVNHAEELVRGRVIWLHTQSLVELVHGVAILAPQIEVLAVSRAGGSQHTVDCSLWCKENADATTCPLRAGGASVNLVTASPDCK